MRNKFVWIPLVSVLSLLGFAGMALGQKTLFPPMVLKENWEVQSSAKVAEKGEVISTPDFRPQGWYPSQVPSTVVAALVINKVYPDPHFGMNLRSYPGMGYQIGQNFSNLPMPPDSPFAVSWWYRTQFSLPTVQAGTRLWLKFDGINFRANVWLNGAQIASSAKMAGAWRVFEFDLAAAAKPGQINALAVEVFAPKPNDLAITFVDWNPAPPDKMMGLFREVSILSSGPVALRHPYVLSDLDLPSLETARLTVMADLRNATEMGVKGILRGSIGTVRFEQPVALAAGETKTVRFAPQQFPQLVFAQPRLWWPFQMGPANLYDLKLDFSINSQVSDQKSIRFGIREIAGEFNAGGHLGFKINGKNILIRGAGYTSEMLLRSTPERQEDEIRYVKDMNLNTIRLEGKLENEHFLNFCDEQGILLLAGWCCCDHWEKWKNWKEEDYLISAESQRDQIRRLRPHASLLAWFNGSDGPPPSKVEQTYIQILRELSWPNPFVSSAKDFPAEFSGPPGVKMRGPYEYVPPIYWYVDTTQGGAFGFNTEAGPGPAVPPLESLKRMFPADKLWPMNEYWTFHAGGGPFKSLDVFTNAMKQRFGTAKGVEDYARKAQAVAYESHRAMFEAFGRNQPNATGVIQWMQNNAWPSLIWHLYDFYLLPGGSYFGAKKACEPLHVQYSYDDRSVVVVNSTLESYAGLKVKAMVLNLDLKEKFNQVESLDASPDCATRTLAIPEIPGLSTTYFLQLTLEDKSGKTVSHNFYWLSTKPDVLDDPKSTWYYTPQKAFADFTPLEALPRAEVKLDSSFSVRGNDQLATVTLKNASPNLAFFLRLKLKKGAEGEEVVPVFWEDNYVSLLPGEIRQLRASCRVKDLEGKTPVVVVETWK